MPQHPGLVAIDFDGTALRSDATVSARTTAAVRATAASGIRVLVVTGRPPRWLDQVAELCGGQGLAVAANGALVVDLASRTLVDRHHFAVTAAAEVLRRLRDALPQVTFGVERSAGFAHEPGYPRGIRNSEKVPGVRFAASDADLLAEPPVKILARVPDHDIDAAAVTAIDVLDDLAGVYFSSTDLIELAPPGVSKATTLAGLAEQWGIVRDDVIAFGDMPNDIPMLSWAGHGVAVANAHADVRAIADEVTASNDDDGVALVLETLLRSS